MAVVPAEQLKVPVDPYGVRDEGDPIDVGDLYDRNMVDIAWLEGGASFGELALVDGKPRAATIKCVQKTHFLTISIDDYDKAQKQIKRNELDKKMDIMKKEVPLFKSAQPTPTILKKLAGVFTNHECTRNCLLIKEGEPASKVYLIVEGEFQISWKVYSKNVQAEDINKIKEDPEKAKKV